ncbi:MAG: anti-sigma factor family protein, partial [Candidatus Methylomirabilales bacterium]
MRCVDVRAEMTAHLAEELGPEIRVQLDAHLAGCASCRAELGVFRETWGTLGALHALRPAPYLEARVLARTTGEALPLRAWRLLQPLRVPIAALAAVLLSVGLSTLVPYEAAARLCREALEGLPLASGLSDAAGAFLVGILYAALPVLPMAILTARLNGRRPLVEGGWTAALFVLILTPYALAVCWALPAAFIGSLLAGLTAGAFTGGPGGFWLGRRVP